MQTRIPLRSTPSTSLNQLVDYHIIIDDECKHTATGTCGMTRVHFHPDDT